MTRVITAPEPCPLCRHGDRGPCLGCTACQWTGQDDWGGEDGPAEGWERRFMADHPDLGNNPPASLIRPGPTGERSGECEPK